MPSLLGCTAGELAALLTCFTPLRHACMPCSSPQHTCIFQAPCRVHRRLRVTLQAWRAAARPHSVGCRDLATGTQLSAFKACGSPPGGVCAVGHSAILAAQTAKDTLHAYAWHSDAVLHRSFVAEKLLCVAALPQATAASCGGELVAGGGASGTLYLWNSSSGRLLATVRAHTKGVAAVGFAGCGTALFTAGQDALLRRWELADALDTNAGPRGVQPTWTGSAALQVPHHCFAQRQH